MTTNDIGFYENNLYIPFPVRYSDLYEGSPVIWGSRTRHTTRPDQSVQRIYENSIYVMVEGIVYLKVVEFVTEMMISVKQGIEIDVEEFTVLAKLPDDFRRL